MLLNCFYLNRVCYNLALFNFGLMTMNAALILFEVDVKFLVVITISMNLSNVSRRICE